VVGDDGFGHQRDYRGKPNLVHILIKNLVPEQCVCLHTHQGRLGPSTGVDLEYAVRATTRGIGLPFVLNRNPRAVRLFEKAPKSWEVVTLFQVEAVGAERRLCSTAR